MRYYGSESRGRWDEDEDQDYSSRRQQYGSQQYGHRSGTRDMNEGAGYGYTRRSGSGYRGEDQRSRSFSDSDRYSSYGNGGRSAYGPGRGEDYPQFAEQEYDRYRDDSEYSRFSRGSQSGYGSSDYEGGRRGEMGRGEMGGTGNARWMSYGTGGSRGSGGSYDDEFSYRPSRSRRYRGSTGSDYGMSGFSSSGSQGYGSSREYGSGGFGSSSFGGTSTGGSYGEQREYYGMGPKGYQRRKESIEEDVNEALMEHPRIDAREIEVKVDDKGVVTLSGSCESRQVKRLCEDVVEEISGVRDVKNEIQVKGRSSMFSSSSESSQKESSQREGSTSSKSKQQQQQH